MALEITTEEVLETKSDCLQHHRNRAGFRNNDRTFEIDLFDCDDEALEELHSIFKKNKKNTQARVIAAVRNSNNGDHDQTVPSFPAFGHLLSGYLKDNAIKHWLFIEGKDGKSYPYMISGIREGVCKASGDKFCNLSLKSYTASRGEDGKLEVDTKTIQFGPSDVARRRIGAILSEAGILVETEELHREYEATMKRHNDLVASGFAQQFRVTGKPYQKGGYYSRRASHEMVENRKVIHDLSPSDYGPHNPRGYATYRSSVHEDGYDTDMPEHPLVKVFDLKKHEFFWVNSDYMEPYEYDKSLGEKLILPETHRDLIDVLTNNLSDFTSDFIEGKNAGNIILCKGLPGVGKTLTAEIYSELIEAPLYSIHSGTLGTDAKGIEGALQLVFDRVNRWNCVLLLDEADVFVSERGADLNKNAILAEFLRTLEYFDGLMFMTTNRPNDIDEAIISRCIAVIDYRPPETPELVRRSWMALEQQFQTDLGEDVRSKLLDMFPNIVQRDMKMLLKLVLKMQKAGKGDLDAETFRKMAMFRAIEIKT